MQLILVTGMSGSGKSVVLNALEDSGYFCIDNLPVGFIEPIAESLQSRSFPRLAIAADTRMREDLRAIRLTLQRLVSAGIEVRLLFLNARTDALIQRYSETRRRHPLSLRPEAIEALGLEGQEESSSLLECIEHEREILVDIEQLGVQMDTTDLKPAALRAWVREFLQLKSGRISLMFQSFAYKDGIPLDADLVFDVRCLSNPHYIEELKPLTGLDPKVASSWRIKPRPRALLRTLPSFCSAGLQSLNMISAATLRWPWAARAGSIARSIAPSSWQRNFMASGPALCVTGG
jgi:Predicted P-loop-containing kinase